MLSIGNGGKTSHYILQFVDEWITFILTAYKVYVILVTLASCFIQDASVWVANGQDRQALLKAKYCPRVAAVSRTQKNTKKLVTLTFDRWPWNSIGF